MADDGRMPLATTPKTVRTHRALGITLLVAAALGHLYAGYWFSFCFLLENDCVLRRANACERLEATLRFVAQATVVSFVVLLAGVAVLVRAALLNARAKPNRQACNAATQQRAAT